MNFNTLTLTLQTFIAAFSSGYSRLQGPIHGLLGIFTTLELTLFGLWAALGHGDNPASAFKKVLHIGAWIWIAQSYPTLLKALVNSLEQAGLLAGGGSGDASLLLDPSRIAGYGLQATKPLVDKIHSLSSFDFADQEIFGFAYLAIMACFFLMAIQVFLATLEYYLFAAVVGILLPFGLFQPTKFLAEKAIGAVVSAGIKLMVLAFILSVFDPVLKAIHFQGTEIKMNELLSVLLTVSALGFFCWKAPGLASSLLAGSPHLGAGEAVRTAVMGAQMGVAGVAGGRDVAASAVSGGRTALSAGTAMRDHMQGLSQAHKVAQGGGGSGGAKGQAAGGKEAGDAASPARSGASASLVQSAMGSGAGSGEAGGGSPASPSVVRSTSGAQSGAAGSSPDGAKAGATASGANTKTPPPASGTRSVGEVAIARAQASGDTARAASLSSPADKSGTPAPGKEPS